MFAHSTDADHSETLADTFGLNWLSDCVSSAPDCVAATAAASLGQLSYGESDSLAAALVRVGPEWRSLVLWGLGQLDPAKAADVADNKLDRLVLGIEQS